MSRFNLKYLSLYRTELMGFAAIGIICCHAYANGVILPKWFTLFFGGQLGVSVFFFLSGLGIWYSLQHVNRCVWWWEGEVYHWYIKRYKKLFIPFLMLAIPFFAYQTISGGHNIWFFITRITTIEFWISGDGAWFVSPLVVLYLIAPWWKMLLQATKLSTVLSMLAFFAVLCFGDLVKNHSSEICFFFLGFWIGPYVLEGRTIRWIPIVIGSIVLYLSFRLIPALQSYQRSIFLVPLFIVLPCLLFDLPWMKRINKVFGLMGTISLESYLCNIFLPMIFIQSSWVRNIHFWNNNIGYLLVAVVGIALAYAVHRFSQKILSKTI